MAKLGVETVRPFTDKVLRAGVEIRVNKMCFGGKTVSEFVLQFGNNSLIKTD